MRIAKLLCVTVVLLTTTCARAARARTLNRQPGAEGRLANTRWVLASFGAEGGQSPVVEGATITLSFGDDGRASGSGGCNSYGGEYTERGEGLSFGPLASTKRACLDERANRQEQRYLAALGAASRFELSGGRLTIFQGDGRGSLNFTSGPAAEAAGERYENLSSPVTLLASFYDAVNSKDYERAFHYWETPPGNLQDFARGYADTAGVRLIVEPPTRVEGAAGSLYSEVPVVLVARGHDGGERVFAGCYVTRKSNLLPTDVPKVEVWRIHSAKVSPVAPDISISKLLAQACGK
ncbi:MAG TPA: META domain-containing protein [Pyrinomonadaceae bacterium]|jgi:heat shock protein HslJ|nr:META domain-containing protein [Pyrinomonadaceae bacterium]